MTPTTPYPPAPPAPRKRRRAWPWVLGGIAAVCALICGIGALAIGGAAKTINDSTKKTHTISYKITGTGAATVTYMGANFAQAQEDGALPWSKTITVTGWQPVVISAQLKASGTVTCEIDVDGHAGTPVTSKGAYVIATCTADTTLAP